MIPILSFTFITEHSNKRGRLPIKLRKGDEGPVDNKGFEGIAVLNDTTFYILLEKVSGKNYSILYKAILRGGQLNIKYNKYLPIEERGRYCDLFYRDRTLYLLKSCFRSDSCDAFQNTYDIMKLNLTNTLDVEDRKSKIEPALHLSLTNCVHKYCSHFNTNVEGITMNTHGDFYIVSDNYNGNPTCEHKGEKGTLLMRITNQ